MYVDLGLGCCVLDFMCCSRCLGNKVIRVRVRKARLRDWLLYLPVLNPYLTAFALSQNTPPKPPTNSMAEEQAAHHLLNVLEERGLDIDLDKILLGFEDEQIKQDAAAWVEEYLHEDTLLSKEELELCVSICSSY